MPVHCICETPLKTLAKFEDTVTNSYQKGILFSIQDYLELVDYTGSCIVPNKRGAIPLNLPPILERLCLDMKTWLQNSEQFEERYRARFLFQTHGLENTG